MEQTNTETKVELSQEEQLVEMRKLSEMKHKTFSQLIGLHVDNFSAIMVNSNGVSYNEKIQAARALKEAIMFALDFGLDVSKSKIRQGGKLAKETNGLAGIMVQALDNRMLLIADNMHKKELEDKSNNVTEQGDTNELEK